MDAEDLLALLGRYNTDPGVEAALSYYRVRNRPVVKVDPDDADGPVVETQTWVKNSRSGIEFGFDDEAAWIGLDETQFGKRPMLLTQIYLYGRHQGVRPYPEPLPFQLELTDERATVRRKLKAFESTRHSHVRDTWDTPQFRITVAFTEGDRGIEFILCALREPPLPPLPYALAPVPAIEVFAELLGCPVSDPRLRRVFDPLGLEDRIEELKDMGEVDFLVPYGFTLGFSSPLGVKKPEWRQRVLSSVTFYQERELDARAWPGELPYGIQFDDSPETAITKVGRPPDVQDDDDFGGYALWHQPTFGFHIFYNSMENRVARASLFAPGFWEKWHADEEGAVTTT